MSGRDDRPSRKTHATFGTSRAVRLAGCDYSTNIDVHLTICAARGEPFRRESVARMICSNVEHYCRQLEYTLYGYCVMPNHAHVLLSPADSGTPISTWLHRFKSFTTNQFVKLGGDPPLWQRSAHDHICRDGETAESVLAYVVNNPVRAGFVEDWQKWPWTQTNIGL